jgi:hypothetical protein
LEIILGWHVVENSFAFWQIVVEKYHAKLKWILQALLGIQRWNLMTLDLLIFFGNVQVLTYIQIGELDVGLTSKEKDHVLQ